MATKIYLSQNEWATFHICWSEWESESSVILHPTSYISSYVTDATMSQHERYKGPETEAAKCSSAIIHSIIFNLSFSYCDMSKYLQWKSYVTHLGSSGLFKMLLLLLSLF